MQTSKLLAKIVLSLLGCLLSFGAVQAQPSTLTTDVRIEYFGVEKGYTTGLQPVTLLCTLRNRGKSILPANTLRLRLSTVLGLEYTGGELRPALPELTPDQAVSFRWIVNPFGAQSNLIMLAVLEPVTAENRTQEPLPVLALLPRLLTSPIVRSYVKSEAEPPRARTNPDWVGNDRVALQVLQTTNRNPVLLLQAKGEKEWLPVAYSFSLVEVSAGEEWQQPWTDSFRVGSSTAKSDSDGASLSLLGMVGKRWNAELSFEVARATGAIQGKLRLVSRRALRVLSVQLPALLGIVDQLPSAKADGSPIPVANPAPPLSDSAPLAAILGKGGTYGITWGGDLGMLDWKWERLPLGDALRAPVLGANCLASENGELVAAGSTLEFRFRIFALGKSQSVQDALLFVR